VDDHARRHEGLERDQEPEDEVRDPDALAALEAELEREHEVQVEVIGLDVTEPDAAQKLLERAGDADVLVNNAGYGKHGAQIDLTVAESTGMVRLNCESLTAICAAFLPRFVARKKGTILNVASVAGFQPIPWFAVYAATKAFVLSFTEAVAEEVRGTGVRVLALCPGAVRSELDVFSHNAGLLGKLPSLSPEEAPVTTATPLSVPMVDPLSIGFRRSCPWAPPRSRPRRR